ncbi:MAG TPA: DUF4126 domain-containing protein [Thermomicrobiales bacterium]|jgi:nitrate reductase NapE component
MDSSVLTGLGLAPPAGLNAYIPLLVLALADRFTDQVTLERPYDFLSSTAGIVVLLVLLTIEIVADKVPGIDHANDLLQSAIRPAAGAISMMAVTNTDDSLNPVVAMVIGLLIAGAVHGVKATSRPAITVSTSGVGNPLISTIEDGIAVFTSIMAILVPIVAVALVIAFGAFLWWTYRRIRNLSRFLARTGRSMTLPKKSNGH